MDEKQKKIGQLRALLQQAKTRIHQLKQQLGQKVLYQNMIGQTNRVGKVIIRKKYLIDSKQKEMKSMQSDQGQIMKQYEERIIRIQKSLQDSDNLVSKYQKLYQQSSKFYETIMNQVTNISNLITKNFVPTLNKDQNQAVQELCSIQKCKDFEQRLEKMQTQTPELQQLIKGMKRLQTYYVQSLNKKRQLRLVYLKKQANFQKQLQEQQKKHASSNTQIQRLNQEIKDMQEKYQKKIQTIAKSKAKMSQQKVNLQFIKQLFIKVLVGPKEASLMAYQVLSKVLKFTPDQYNNTKKKIK